MYANNFIEHEMEPPRDQLIDAYLPSYRRQQLPNSLDRKDWIEILLAAFSFIFDESEMRLNVFEYQEISFQILSKSFAFKTNKIVI